MSTGAIGSISRLDAEQASYVILGPGSTAQRVEGEINLGSVDVQIGAVEIKDANSDERVTIGVDNGSVIGSNFMPVGGIYNATTPS